MTVIDVGISDDVDELAGLKAAYLGEHVDEKRILEDVPVIRGEHVVRTLIEDAIEAITFDVEGHAISAGIEVHLMQIFKVIDIRHDATGIRVMLQIVKDAVDLVEFPFGVDGLFAKLIAIGFANGAGLIGPRVPDVGL